MRQLSCWRSVGNRTPHARSCARELATASAASVSATGGTAAATASVNPVKLARKSLPRVPVIHARDAVCERFNDLKLLIVGPLNF